MKHLKSFALFSVVLFCMSINFSFAQSSRFSMEKYINGNDTLYYRQLFPDADTMRKYPLLIFLHGSGERGHDNEAQLKWGVMNFATDQNMVLHPALVIAPQCPDKMGWSNFSRGDMKLQPAPSKPMQLLIELIHKLIKTMPVIVIGSISPGFQWVVS